ncbi:MAG: PrsW family intramembrane metalloprotease [Arachnia propionica]|uniref:PrsW family intramembrane metalloprotease n=1 Tax=Arachnia propionica TaxID=1750 RepID=UPI00270493E9|nr:PrsW family intramembrane metalloprotease [Arachnia propionica]
MTTGASDTKDLVLADRRRWLSGLPPATPRPWWKRLLRSPMLWLTLVLVPFYCYCLASQYMMLHPDRTFPDGTVALGLNNEAIRIAAFWAMWTALAYFLLFVWLDRFRLQRPLTWLLTFAWGACASTWISIHVNSWAGEMMQTTQADADAGTRPAIFIAPFIEEASKATVLFLLVILYRTRIVSQLSIVTLAGLSAIGFAFVENIIYYGRVIVYAMNTIEVEDPQEAVMSMVMLRGVYTSFGHPLFTMMTALGLAVALGARSKWVRVTAPLGGFLLAAGGHMLFNGVASLNPVDALRTQWFMALALVGVLILYLIFSVVAETRLIRRRLTDLHRVGWLQERDVVVISSPLRRIKLLTAALFRGPRTWWHTARFIRLVTELAHTRAQVTRGTVGPGADDRCHELVHQIESLRPKALTETLGLAVIPPRRRRRPTPPVPVHPQQGWYS